MDLNIALMAFIIFRSAAAVSVPSHIWDFRGCSGTFLVDAFSSLTATFLNGATCSFTGIVLDGNDDYVDIDDWEWGGATSIEAYVKFESFNRYSNVIDFGTGASNNIRLANFATSSSIGWWVLQGSTGKGIVTSNFDSSTRTHVVVTVKNTTMKVYKHCVLVGTKTERFEPNIMTRTNHWLGRSPWTDNVYNGYFHGTIAYVKIWHGIELTDSDAAALYALRDGCTSQPTPAPSSSTSITSNPTIDCPNAITGVGVSKEDLQHF